MTKITLVTDAVFAYIVILREWWEMLFGHTSLLQTSYISAIIWQDSWRFFINNTQDA